MELQIIKQGCQELVLLSQGNYVVMHHHADGTVAVGFTDGCAGRVWEPIKTYKTRDGALRFARKQAEIAQRAEQSRRIPARAGHGLP